MITQLVKVYLLTAHKGKKTGDSVEVDEIRAKQWVEDEIASFDPPQTDKKVKKGKTIDSFKT